MPKRVKSVTGYIIVNIETNTKKIITSNFSDDTNIILADNADETDENKILSINIPSQGKFKESIVNQTILVKDRIKRSSR